MAQSELPERRQGLEEIESTGERFLPWGNDPVCAYEHLHRYSYIARYVKGKRVLDLASGEGYGTAILARNAAFAVGIEIDEKAVHHARNKYLAENLRFILGSITDIPLAAHFDVIICFEAIEHIYAQEKLLCEVKRLLAPDGLFVISTPNKSEYRVQESPNPFHVKELDFEEFKGLLANQFKQVKFLAQRVQSGSSLWPCESKRSGELSGSFINYSEGEFVISEAAQRTPLYYVGVASNAVSMPDFPPEFLQDSSNTLAKTHEQTLAWCIEQMKQQERSIDNLKEALQWRTEQVKQHERSIGNLKEALEWQKMQQEDLQVQLDSTKSGRTWRFIQMLMRIHELAFPTFSRSRSIYNRLVQNLHL